MYFYSSEDQNCCVNRMSGNTCANDFIQYPDAFVGNLVLLPVVNLLPSTCPCRPCRSTALLNLQSLLKATTFCEFVHLLSTKSLANLIQLCWIHNRILLQLVC